MSVCRTVALFTCLLVCVASFVQAKATQPKTPSIVKLLDKQRNEIEKILGKPEKTGANEDMGYEWCQYKLADTKGVRVFYFATGGGLPKTSAGPFQVSFGETVTWKQACTALGMKTTSLKAKPLSNIPGMTTLTGHRIKNWNVHYSGPNAKYPANEGAAPQLINENGGLPMIEFELRSVNE